MPTQPVLRLQARREGDSSDDRALNLLNTNGRDPTGYSRSCGHRSGNQVLPHFSRWKVQRGHGRSVFPASFGSVLASPTEGFHQKCGKTEISVTFHRQASAIDSDSFLGLFQTQGE